MPAPISVDQTVTTPCGENFKTTAKHRSGSNPEGSIWSITIAEEYNCFIDAMAYCNPRKITPINYTSDPDTIRWGVIIQGGKVSKIGENNLNNRLLFAKFTNHINNSEWHGYPADYRNKVQDRPNINFLLSLSKNGCFSKSKASKISRGETCNM